MNQYQIMFEDAITVLIGYFAELTDCFGNNTNPLVGFYFKEYIVHLSFDGSIGNAFDNPELMKEGVQP